MQTDPQFRNKLLLDGTKQEKKLLCIVRIFAIIRLPSDNFVFVLCRKCSEETDE